jgi:hypothetical protein
MSELKSLQFSAQKLIACGEGEMRKERMFGLKELLRARLPAAILKPTNQPKSVTLHMVRCDL